MVTLSDLMDALLIAELENLVLPVQHPDLHEQLHVELMAVMYGLTEHLKNVMMHQMESLMNGMVAINV